MPNMPWFRFYSETLNDRKIRRICAATNQPKALIIGAWATILALANDSPERGRLMISDGLWMTREEVREETGIDDMDFDLIVYHFEALGMINSVDEGQFTIANWDNRQFKSDHSSPRVEKHRKEKKRREAEQEKQDCNVAPALQKQPEGVIDTDTEQTDTTEEDSKGGASATPPPKKRTRTKPKKPIPEAVNVFRQAAHRYPAKSWYGRVADAVGTKVDDLAFWSQVVTEWVGLGFNPTNVKGMLDCYGRRELPGITRASPRGSPDPSLPDYDNDPRYTDP